MRAKVLAWLLISVLTAVSACSVVSHPVKKAATSGVPFPTLAAEAERYRDQTVVLGGYLLKTENLEIETLLTVLQAPLGIRDEPGSKDRSQGRFQVRWNGFLDPEVYKKGRRVTVAGRVVGSRMRRVGSRSVSYLQLTGIEIHLWKNHQSAYGAPFYPYYYDPWPWYGSFYWGHYFHHRPPYRPRPPHVRPPHKPRPPHRLQPPKAWSH